MAATPARLPVGTTIWHTYSNYVTCTNDHLLKFYETGYRADMRRLSGHAFFECRQCQPSTYFLAVYTTTPSPMVTCYGIGRESYDYWNKAAEQTPETPELLHLLKDPEGRSYNPYWTPQRPREKR